MLDSRKPHFVIVPRGVRLSAIVIGLCVYFMKSQIFLDGNKRASVIFANHYLIPHGKGLLVILENNVSEFKKLLVEYYEGEDLQVIASFMREYCWRH